MNDIRASFHILVLHARPDMNAGRDMEAGPDMDAGPDTLSLFLVEGVIWKLARVLKLARIWRPARIQFRGKSAPGVSSENRPQTVISANLALSSPYFTRTNPDSPEGRPGRSSC
eukprot:scaffold1734_cov64-Cyclotella_meneghiniana.AAC.1